MFTTVLRLAAIFCARVVIVACQDLDARTATLHAFVDLSAGIAIVTCPIDRTKHAVTIVARICRAWVVIVAVHRGTWLTAPVLAKVACGAWIGIIAESDRIDVITTALRKAAIGGTGITVIAIETPLAGAIPLIACVIHCAAIVIITIELVGGKEAAAHWVTGIGRACITVITGQECRPG